MVIAAFALNWLDDDCADVGASLLKREPDFLLGFFFARNHVSLAFALGQREIDRWIRDARPIEFREKLDLSRIGIR